MRCDSQGPTPPATRPTRPHPQPGIPPEAAAPLYVTALPKAALNGSVVHAGVRLRAVPVLHHDLSVLREVAVEDVRHELVAMVATVGAMARVRSVQLVDVLPAPSLDPGKAVRESLLEAHLVHVRNLHEFLSRRAVGLPHPETVVAEHYFDGERVGTAPLTADEVKEIHSRVAHVSVKRRTPLSVDDPTWATIAGPWAPMVVDHFRRFVDDLAAVHPDRAEWFGPALAVAESAVSSS